MLKRLLLLAALLIVRYHATVPHGRDAQNESSFPENFYRVTSGYDYSSGFCPLLQRMYSALRTGQEGKDLKGPKITGQHHRADQQVLERRANELQQENQRLRCRLNELQQKDSDPGASYLQHNSGIFNRQQAVSIK